MLQNFEATNNFKEVEYAITYPFNDTVISYDSEGLCCINM